MMLYLSCDPQRLGGLDRTEPVRLPQVEILFKAINDGLRTWKTGGVSN